MQNQFASQVEIGSQYNAVVATVLFCCLAFHLAAREAILCVTRTISVMNSTSSFIVCRKIFNNQHSKQNDAFLLTS
jgi:hypothetical protein